MSKDVIIFLSLKSAFKIRTDLNYKINYKLDLTNNFIIV